MGISFTFVTDICQQWTYLIPFWPFSVIWLCQKQLSLFLPLPSYILLKKETKVKFFKDIYSLLTFRTLKQINANINVNFLCMLLMVPDINSDKPKHSSAHNSCSAHNHVEVQTRELIQSDGPLIQSSLPLHQKKCPIQLTFIMVLIYLSYSFLPVLQFLLYWTDHVVCDRTTTHRY